MKKTVAAFDFDGTITTHDTFFAFIIYKCGKKKLIRAILFHLPYLLAYKLKLYPNWKAKERIFSFCFAGMADVDFYESGKQFANTHRHLLRSTALNAMEKHLQNNAIVYIISAGIDAWVAPFFASYPSVQCLTTSAEVNNGKLTGCLGGTNCYGGEKVRRLLENEPLRSTYILYAYGDSKGDRELLSEADFAYFRPFEETESAENT